MNLPSMNYLHTYAARLLSHYSNDNLSLQTALTQMSDLWAIARANAGLAQHVAFLFRKGLRGMFITLANSEMLDTIVRDRYDEQRLSATPSRGYVVAWMYPARDDDFLIEAGTRMVTPNGRAIVRWDTSIPGGSTDKVLVEVYSDRAGTGTGAGWGEITQFEGSPAAEIHVSNSKDYESIGATMMAGGSDVESLEEFRARSKSMWQASRAGTLKALEYGAISTPGYGVRKARALTKTGQAGRVFMYVADADGRSTTVMTDAVEAYLDENWLAAGEELHVYGGVVEEQSVELELTIISPYSYNAVKQRVIEELVALGAKQQPGERLRLAAIYAALERVPGLLVLRHGEDRTVVSPVADIVPSDDTKVLTISKSGITFVADVV